METRIDQSTKDISNQRILTITKSLITMQIIGDQRKIMTICGGLNPPAQQNEGSSAENAWNAWNPLETIPPSAFRQRVEQAYTNPLSILCVLVADRAIRPPICSRFHNLLLTANPSGKWTQAVCAPCVGKITEVRKWTHGFRQVD